MSTDKPLNVRCAEALGWKRPSEMGRCDRCGWPLVEEGGMGCWPSNCSMRYEGQEPTRADTAPPYGDDTPEGWACTGPLIGRFGLTLEKQGCSSSAYECWDHNQGLVWSGPNACAAVAEWVAEHVTNGEVKA